MRKEVIGLATLYCGDCREIAPSLERPAALISDPPYGISHFKGASGKGKHIRRNSQIIEGDNEPFDPAQWVDFADSVLLWGADHYASGLPHGRWLAWNKLDGLASYDSFSDVEFAWHNQRGAARIFSHLWKGICQASGKDEGRNHPTQKPIPLMEWCIQQAKVPINGVVFDPYAGAGSTMIAAVKMRYPAIGIEIDPGYFDIACRRIEAAQRQYDMFRDA